MKPSTPGNLELSGPNPYDPLGPTAMRGVTEWTAPVVVVAARHDRPGSVPPWLIRPSVLLDVGQRVGPAATSAGTDPLCRDHCGRLLGWRPAAGPATTRAASRAGKAVRSACCLAIHAEHRFMIETSSSPSAGETQNTLTRPEMLRQAGVQRAVRDQTVMR